MLPGRHSRLPVFVLCAAACAAPLRAEQAMPLWQTTQPLVAQLPAADGPLITPMAVRPLPDFAVPPAPEQQAAPLFPPYTTPAYAPPVYRAPPIAAPTYPQAAAMMAAQPAPTVAHGPELPATAASPVEAPHLAPHLAPHFAPPIAQPTLAEPPPVATQPLPPQEPVFAPPGQPPGEIIPTAPPDAALPLPPVQGQQPLPQWQELSDTAPLHAHWNRGLWLESPAGDFRMHIGGLIQFEGGWFSADPGIENAPPRGTGPVNDSVQFRRGRFRMEGAMYETIEFAAEVDFVNDEFDPSRRRDHGPAVTDLYAGITHLPYVDGIRIGSFREPIGLEHLTDPHALTFMERSTGFDAFLENFNDGYSPGVMAYRALPAHRATWAAGVFKNTSNPFGYGIGEPEYAATGRVTLLPMYYDDGRYLLHLGLGASARGLDDGINRYRARGGVRSGPPGPLNPYYADSGVYRGENESIINVEVAANGGPWGFQSEYTGVLVSDVTWFSPLGVVGQNNLLLQSYYAEVSWFITGEHRSYDVRRGVFDRVVPLENFFCVPGACGVESGMGAWQLAARYSLLDLADEGWPGGKLYGITLGLNWLLNPQMKLQLNYEIARRSNVAYGGDIHGLGARMSLEF